MSLFYDLPGMSVRIPVAMMCAVPAIVGVLLAAATVMVAGG